MKRTLILLLLVAFPLLSLSNVGFLRKVKSLDSNYFATVFKEIQNGYVEDIKQTELYEKALSGLLQNLDPYSEYFSPKEYEKLMSVSAGEFGGIGVEIIKEAGVLKVVTPTEGGSAYKAGIKSGDFITIVNGEPLQGMKLNDAIEKVRGRIGTSVKITVFRESDNKFHDYTLKREAVKIAPVKAKIIENDTLYIRIPMFNKQTTESLEEEIKGILASNIKGAILDLRNNPGGLLDQAINVTDMFLDKGNIVSVKSRKKTDNFEATAGDILNGMPMVVIVNAGTASAPEIVSGALKDNKRAVIIGEKTFGKGSVQTVFPLENDGAMKLTTARYYTPSGRSIQADGIEPDIYVEQAVVKPIEGKKELYESSFNNHLKNERDVDSAPISRKRLDYQDYSSDFQLSRAIDTLKSMILLKGR